MEETTFDCPKSSSVSFLGHKSTHITSISTEMSVNAFENLVNIKDVFLISQKKDLF